MSKGEIGDFDRNRINDREAAVSMLMWNDQGKPSVWGLGNDIAGFGKKKNHIFTLWYAEFVVITGGLFGGGGGQEVSNVHSW